MNDCTEKNNKFPPNYSRKNNSSFRSNILHSLIGMAI